MPVTTNEQNYDTLKAVRSLMASALDGLYKEFNAFDVLGDGTDEAIKDKMVRKIAGNQTAYDIIAPLLDAVDTAIQGADNNFLERNAK